ncbi:Panacea domain-containing protein [Brytella acorum]|uniref:DUF4065 domain-containing protein n=1 Tax=Brytella acorum TaxID=2959299 RepID=A0AA35V428_9PROT|nr:type II toxin-antitoxin system antitoxin SocA domain-containing protein [Brytella acorum]CAI9119543.1 DUF4065 domain-containing protein [Brytella acorum]
MSTANAVANRFLELAENDNSQLTPMQVLKLVYMAHGWMLGLYHRPLIDQRIEAWRYGPVIPTLYDAMRHFRSSPVTGRLPANDNILDPSESDVVEQVYRNYGHLSGIALSRLTHQSGTPWEQTYRGDFMGDEIPNDVIEAYYAGRAARAA